MNDKLKTIIDIDRAAGNLSLIKLLYNSNIINSNDKITFFDGDVSYGFNILLNKKKNYYIPIYVVHCHCYNNVY